MSLKIRSWMRSDEELHVGDLALAAVLKDESNWWDAI